MNRLLLIPMIFLLTSCGPVPVPPFSTYSLTVSPTSVSAHRALTPNTLYVQNIIADPGFNTSKMLYVNIPYKLKAFANNAWVAPPAAMLLPMLVNSLQQTHHYKAVMTAPYSGVANEVLLVRLMKLQQEFLRPTSQERLELSVTVLNGKTNAIIKNKSFQSVISAPTNDPYGGVLAANKAAQSLMQKIARYVIS